MQRADKWLIDSSVIMKENSEDDVNLIVVKEVVCEEGDCDISLFEPNDIRLINLPQDITSNLSKESFDIWIYILTLYREIDIYNSRCLINPCIDMLNKSKAIRISLYHFGLEAINRAIGEILIWCENSCMGKSVREFTKDVVKRIDDSVHLFFGNTEIFSDRNKITLMRYSNVHHFIESFYEI